MVTDPVSAVTQPEEKQIQPVAGQPKQTQQQRRLSSLYNIVNTAKPDDTLKKSGQADLAKVKNVADVNKQTAEQLDQKSKGLQETKFDMTQAWKPPEGQSIIADEGANKSTGFQMAAADTNVADDINRATEKEATGKMGSLSFRRDITPEQIDRTVAQEKEKALLKFKDLYRGAENALTSYTDDAARFLDSTNANVDTFAAVGQQNAVETDAQALASGLASGQISDAGLLNLISAYGANNPDLAAINAQIYNADIQNLRNQAGTELAGLEAAQGQRSIARDRLQATAQDTRKRLTDWTQSERDRLSGELNTGLQQIEKSAQEGATAAKTKESDRKAGIENERKARVERNTSEAGSFTTKFKPGSIDATYGIPNGNPSKAPTAMLESASQDAASSLQRMIDLSRNPDIDPKRRDELVKSAEALEKRLKVYNDILLGRGIESAMSGWNPNGLGTF